MRPAEVVVMNVAERVIMGDPGPAGRFGPFGGRFVPEALEIGRAHV